MSSYQEFKIGSLCAQPKIARAYVRETGSTYRHGENVSPWRNNEGTSMKQSKITLTSLFITCMYSDIHTNCRCVSVSSFTLQHPCCPKWFITLQIQHIWVSFPVRISKTLHLFFFSLCYWWGSSFPPSHIWDTFLKSSSNHFKYKLIETLCCVIHRHPLGGLVAKRGSHV